MSKRSSGPLRSSPPTKPTRLSVRVAGGLAILAIVYGALVGGEILAELRLDALQEKAARTYAEAFEIEADRFRTEDIPQIHEAVAQGYEQNLFLTAFERGDFLELTGQHKIAPLAPQPLSQLYYCNEGYGLVRYESDRFGFRNDDALWERPDIDAVLIGDSYVHGACVDHANTIAGHMQANGLDAALNLATGGNGPIHYAALAKTFLPVIKPKYALFFFFANDNKDETQSVYRKVFFGDVAPTYFQPQDGQGRPSRVSDALAGLYGEARALLHVPGVDSTLVPAPMAHTRPHLKSLSLKR